MKTTKILTLTTITACLALTSCKKDDDDNNQTSTACSMVITNANGPQAGDTYISLDANYDDLIVDSLLNISGSDKTWDFSSLTENGTENDTLVFKGEADVPNSIDANLVIGDDDNALFLKSSLTGLDLISANFGTDVDLDYEITNSLSIIPYSLKMNKVITDDYVIEAMVYDTIDTVIAPFGTQSIPLEIGVIQSNSNEFTVDGCGTIITPKGEFDCLRYVVEPGEADLDVTVTSSVLGNIPVTDDQIAEYTDDEDFNMFEGTTYVWISKNYGYPLLQVTLNENGSIEYVEYLK